MKRRRSRYNSHMPRGDYEEMEGSWTGTTAAAVASGRIFAVCQRALYAIDPADGTSAAFEGGWDTLQLAPIGASLFAFERSGSLYRIASGDGAWTELEGSYLDLRAACGTDGAVFAVVGPTLYRLDVDGVATVLEGTWDPAVIAGVDAQLFAFEKSGDFYRADAKTGAWTELPGPYLSTTAACGHAGRIYAVSEGVLWDIDPATGAADEINRGWTTTHLVGAGHELFAFEQSGSLFKIALS